MESLIEKFIKLSLCKKIGTIILAFFIPWMLLIFILLSFWLLKLVKTMIPISLNISREHYFYYFIYLLTIISTSIFSYFIYRSSDKSYKLTEKINDRNSIKENEAIRENALIVYYDLILGLKDIIKLYTGLKLNKLDSEYRLNDYIPKRMFFSNEWIKNVALISNDKRIKDKVADIYLLYGELLTIQSFLEGYNADIRLSDNLVYSFDIIENLFFRLFIANDLYELIYGDIILSKEVNLIDKLKLIRKFKLIPTNPGENKEQLIKNALKDPYYKILKALQEVIDDPIPNLEDKK